MSSLRSASLALALALAAPLSAGCGSSSPTPADPGGGACGDGVRQAGEQCDDGNGANLDGCDATCRFEQVLRANALAIAWDTSATCTANALGGAVTLPLAQQLVNQGLQGKVDSGALGLMLQARGLDDLTGGADASFGVGVFAGTAAPAFVNAAQRDQWFGAVAGTVDAARAPRHVLAATAASGVTTAGPGRVEVPFSFMSDVAPLTLLGARLRYTAGAASAPAASAGGPPGHLAAEHLDPSLQSFQSAGGGELCGATQAASLRDIPLSAQLRGPCAGYGPANSFLDLLVGGCSGVSSPTQPDTVDAAAPVLGAGGPYTLVADPAKIVGGCLDRTGAIVDLSGCLAAAGYSTRLTFSADRVIVRPACGDAAVQAGEACDDANLVGGDGCDQSCRVEAGWTCAGSPSVCTTPCGNGRLDAGEACDDGNQVDGDGCSARCTAETGYACNGQPSICESVCGDGVRTFQEQCDDGNISDGDGCSAACSFEPGFICDGEPSTCFTVCGDGVPAPGGGEACDDGNASDGDGCSATCQIETGFVCSGSPSACFTVCGDGLVAAFEPCDDGNLINGDGCSTTCQVDPGWTCTGAPSVCSPP